MELYLRRDTDWIVCCNSATEHNVDRGCNVQLGCNKAGTKLGELL